MLEHIPLPAEVLHELAGQLHCIPFHTANARHVALVDLREHVVQAVAKLMEQGDDVVVRQQRRFAIHAIGKVADQMGYGGLQLAGIRAQPAGAHVIHPGAAALAGTGGLVQVELAYQFTVAFNAVKLHRGMPHGCAVTANCYLEQRFDDLEQPRQHFGGCEVLLDLLLAEGVACLLELFSNVGPIPGFRRRKTQLRAGKFAHVSHVFFSVRASTVGQVTQEVNDFGGRLRHLRHHRHLAKIGVAQQLRFFLAQCQDFVDQRGVVKLAGIALGLFGSACHESAVQLFTQIRTLGELHDRQVARHLQRELVAILALGLGSGQRCLLHIGRYTF